ncbi:cilia- and flagella-associated protein 206-like [Oscarella lobularis]|uniref:cilia- and flagella-associated protein 206-like n=1 Tax=Oscarella lobularis TaxID=121494 RepID=UPI003313302D
MSRAQAESVIKSIIREISQECSGKGHAVSETLVAFMVKAVVLDPDNGFNVDRSLTKDDVQKLIEMCVEKLMDTESPSLETIKMQVYFDMNYTSRDEFLEEHKRVLESRLQPVVRDITDSRARTRDEFEALYRKIVSCALLRSGLGSPTDISVVREATAALQSVFPQTELGNFLHLTKPDKEKQLKELTQIMTGIRLFNRNAGKGGQGIDDLLAILSEAIPATERNIDVELHRTTQLVFKYTAIIEKATGIGYRDEIPLEFIKQAQINCRQHEVFLRILMNDVVVSAEKVRLFEAEFREKMQSLKETVQSKTAVPTAHVYPLFVDLSDLWTGFQDEMVLLSVLSNILANLDPFTKIHSAKMTDDVLEPLLANVIILTDQERVTKSMKAKDRIDRTAYRKLEWHYPETTRDFEHLPFEYKGFCSFSVAAYDRLLLPSNPNIGVLRYKEKYYCFSSKEAAEKFASNPELYISGVIDVAKASPELIQLLELHAQFAAITPYSGERRSKKLVKKPVTRCDAGVQTEVHPLEVNMVKSYEWNEWELRRKAIKLANLRTKVTHSAQTDLSHHRRDMETQVYLPKEVEIQTKRAKHTSVPTPSRYLAGLRGGPPGQTKMIDVDLTMDVDTHQIADDYEPKNH